MYAVDMSDRITKEWTENSEQAFGSSGRKGDIGEPIAAQIIRGAGFEVKHYPSDEQRQRSGHDLVIVKDDIEYGVDVKNNLFAADWVYVDKPAIKKSDATFWFHLNDDDHSDWVMYTVDKMRQHAKGEKVWYNKKNEPYYRIKREHIRFL